MGRRFLASLVFLLLPAVANAQFCDPTVSSTTTGSRLNMTVPSSNQCTYDDVMSQFFTQFDTNVCTVDTDNCGLLLTCDDEDVLQWTAGTSSWDCSAVAAGSGDITAVGDCVTGACFTAGSPDAALTFDNATSGTVTLQTVAGALGAVTLSMPATTGTVITSGDTDTVTSTMLLDDTVLLVDIADAIKSGADATLITGTAGGSGLCAEWNADGDLVVAASAAACGAGTMSSFSVDGDNTSPQVISDGNTFLVAGGQSITTTAAATDKVTVAVTASSIGSAQMADSDHGDVAWTTNVAAVEAVQTDAVGQILDIASAIKSGADGTLVTGTAGTSGNCVEWNGDGDVVDAGAACGAGSGDVTDVGAGCSTGACLTDGLATTGTSIFVWEGNVADAEQVSFEMSSIEPASAFTLTFPDATGTFAVDATSITDLDGDGMTITTNALNVVGGNAITANANDVAVTLDSIDEDELAATITFADGDLLDFGTNISSATEGILLPAHLTTCATATAEAQICWEEDANILHIGDGAAIQDFPPASAFSQDVTLTGTGVASVVDVQTDAVAEILDIAAAIKSGLDGTLVTGTAGTGGNCAEWNADGDLVEAASAAACGAGAGDSITVNSTAVDTTANFFDGDIDWTLVDGGAGGPDDITGTVACTGCIDATDIATSAVETAEILDDTILLIDIADAIKSGDDATLVTGTAGGTGVCAEWDANGDLIAAGSGTSCNTLLNDIGDADGIGVVNAAEFAQSWQWDTAATAAAKDAFTLAYNYDPITADVTQQRVLVVQSSDGANDAAGTFETILVVQHNDTNDPATTGLEIASAAGGMSIGIDASDADITTALSVGANTISGTTPAIDFTNFDVGTGGEITVAAGTGLDTNAAGALDIGVTNATSVDYGSASVTAHTFSADGTTDADFVVPNTSIGASEIVSDTITTTQLNATLTFADGDLLDLDAIDVSSTAEGVLLPQNTDCSAGTAEGQVCWDTDGDTLLIGDGATQVDCCASGGSMSSFFLDGDNTSPQTISDGQTALIAGGTNGIDTVAGVTDTVTVNFDPTEVGTVTWLGNAASIWSFDTDGAVDPEIQFVTNEFNFNPSDLDVDLRYEGDTDTDLFIIDAGSDSINMSMTGGVANDVLNVMGRLTIRAPTEVGGAGAGWRGTITNGSSDSVLLFMGDSKFVVENATDATPLETSYRILINPGDDATTQTQLILDKAGLSVLGDGAAGSFVNPRAELDIQDPTPVIGWEDQDMTTAELHATEAVTCTTVGAPDCIYNLSIMEGGAALESRFQIDGGGGITVGSANNDSFTVTTDSTGTGEVVLPLQSIEGAEIVNDTINATQIDETVAYTWTGEHDFGDGGIEIENNDALPGSCTVGQLFLDTNETSGAQLFACEGGSFVLQGGGGGAPTDATYLTQTANGTLTNEQVMGALGTGITINTTTTGVQSIYAGDSCTNQFPRSLDASGAFTCASVAFTDIVDDTITFAQISDSSAIDADTVFTAADTIGITWQPTHTNGDTNFFVIDANQTDDGDGIDDFDAMRIELVSESADTGDTIEGLVISQEAGAANTIIDAGIRIENLEDLLGTMAAGIIVEATTDNAILVALDVEDPEIGTGLSIGANQLLGTTGIINYTNFDVDATGEITVAAGTGIDTNGAGALDVGVNNATSVIYGSASVTSHTFSGDVHIGDGATTLVGKLEVGGDADQPQLVVEANATQTDSVFIVQSDAAGQESFNVDIVTDHEWSPIVEDVHVGDADEGIIGFGSGYLGQADDTVSTTVFDDAIVLYNPTDQIEDISFMFIGSGDVPRFVIAEEGADLATYNPRSMVFGPAATASNVDENILCSSNFDRIDCDTGVTGADIGVQDDFELGGSIFQHGTQGDGFETELTFTTPTADRTVTIPDATGEVTLLGQTHDHLDAAGGGSTLSGKQTRNASPVNDDDCTGEQGDWWYDDTDSQFEFCNANSGAPATLAAASVGGSDTQVQYNNGGVFGGASNLTYNDLGTSPTINVLGPDGGSGPAADTETIAQFVNAAAAGDNALVSVISGSTGNAVLNFGDTGDENAAIIDYDNNADSLLIQADGGSGTAAITLGNATVLEGPATAPGGVWELFDIWPSLTSKPVTGGTTHVINFDPTYTHENGVIYQIRSDPQVSLAGAGGIQMYGWQAGGDYESTTDNAAFFAEFRMFSGSPYIFSQTAGAEPMSSVIFNNGTATVCEDNACGTVGVSAGDTSSYQIGFWNRPGVTTKDNADSSMTLTNLTGFRDAPLVNETLGTLTVTTRRGIHILDIAGSGTPTITTNVALEVDDMTRATTNLSILSEGSAVEMRHAGPVVVGANQATEANLQVVGPDGAGTTPGLDVETTAIFENSAATGDNANISVIAGATGNSILHFGDTADENVGMLDYDHNDDSLDIVTASQTAPQVTVDSDGVLTFDEYGSDSGEQCNGKTNPVITTTDAAGTVGCVEDQAPTVTARSTTIQDSTCGNGANDDIAFIDVTLTGSRVAMVSATVDASSAGNDTDVEWTLWEGTSGTPETTSLQQMIDELANNSDGREINTLTTLQTSTVSGSRRYTLTCNGSAAHTINAVEIFVIEYQ